MISALILSLMAVSSLHSEAAIKDYIAYRAQDNGANVAISLAIADAESGFNVDAKNGSSTASGIFQYVNKTFKYLCIDRYKLTDSMEHKNNPYIQIECTTRRLAEPNGVKEWEASRHQWEKMLDN